jgi:hypothetical protein
MLRSARFKAIVMCFMALVTAVVVSAARVEASAAAVPDAECRCQQECDGLKAGCELTCNAAFSGTELDDCLGDCNAEYMFCSYGACSCDDGPEVPTCYLCHVAQGTPPVCPTCIVWWTGWLEWGCEPVASYYCE